MMSNNEGLEPRLLAVYSYYLERKQNLLNATERLVSGMINRLKDEDFLMVSDHLIIIPYVPLQPKINGILERYFYPLMSVFFRRIDRLKPIAIGSSWRVQS